VLQGVHHGVATIQGTLRPDGRFADLLRRRFREIDHRGPKIRAMQIIRELEGRARGCTRGRSGTSAIAAMCR